MRQDANARDAYHRLRASIRAYGIGSIPVARDGGRACAEDERIRVNDFDVGFAIWAASCPRHCSGIQSRHKVRESFSGSFLSL